MELSGSNVLRYEMADGTSLIVRPSGTEPKVKVYILTSGETNEMMTDMGITMISGMVISTIVTLVFTPVYYSVIDNISHMFSRKKNKKAQVPAEA